MITDYLLRAARIGSTWVLYLLLGLSIISIAVMVERWLYFRRLRDPNGRLRPLLASALRTGNFAEVERLLAGSRTVEAGVVLRSLGWRNRGPRAVADAVESELEEIKPQLARGSNFLGTLGNNAPFIGLFGTVLGVIEAFHQLGAGPNKAAMGNVMTGIAEALVATGVGLFVALPAVIAFNVFQKRLAEIEDATRGLGKLVTAALEAKVTEIEEPQQTEVEVETPPVTRSRATSIAAAVAAESV